MAESGTTPLWLIPWALRWVSWSRMPLLPDAVTQLGIFGWSGMVSRNLSSSNLNFSVLTLLMSQIFWQRVVQPRPKYSYCILLKVLCWVSICWILNNALCSMSWMFSGFYCAINIWHHMLCYLPNIYNYITFTASLERVQFELVQSFPVV